MKKNKPYIFVIGFLVLISITTIIFKKYNYYYEHRTENEIKKNVVIVKNGKVKKENERKLVLVSGKLNYDNEVLHDDLFWVYKKTPKLLRVVEMYQWYEYTETNNNGEIIYKYGKKWSHEIIDSSGFKNEGHENPRYKVTGTAFKTANIIKIGDFELSKDLIEKLPCNKRLKLPSDVPLYSDFKLYDNYVTNSENPEEPKVGDNRISYYYNDWKKTTVLAKQSKNSFKNYTAKNKDLINYIEEGNLNLNELLELQNKDE